MWCQALVLFSREVKKNNSLIVCFSVGTLLSPRVFFPFGFKYYVLQCDKIGERRGSMPGLAGAVPASLVSAFDFDQSDGDRLALDLGARAPPSVL